MNNVNGKPTAAVRFNSTTSDAAAAADPLRHHRSRKPRSSCRASPSRTRITPDLDVGVRVLGRHREPEVDGRAVGPARQLRGVTSSRTACSRSTRRTTSSRPAASARRIAPTPEHRARRELHAADRHPREGPRVRRRTARASTLGGAADHRRSRRPIARRAARPAARRRELKACVDLALPMTAQLGGRYKFLDADRQAAGDIELDLDWEHWGRLPSRLRQRSDLLEPERLPRHRRRRGQRPRRARSGITLKTASSQHGLQDTYGVRLGGSYNFPLGATHDRSLRGGIGYDTAAAKHRLGARRSRRRGAHDDRGRRVVQDRSGFESTPASA